MFFSRRRYSTSFWFLLPELPLVVSLCDNPFFPPSTASARGLALCPYCCFLCLRAGFCLAVASVAAVVGVASWGAQMVGTCTTSGVAWVTDSASTISRFVRFMGTASWVWGLESQVPLQLEGWSERPDCLSCPVLSSGVCCCSQGTRVVCMASPATPGFSGATGSPLVLGGDGIPSIASVVPAFCFLCVFHSTHL